MNAHLLRLKVRSLRQEAIDIKSYELVNIEGRELPPFTAGSHIDLHLSEGCVRQYSLCNDPSERTRYVIAVLNDRNGRGGSRLIHESFAIGTEIDVSPPRNNFNVAQDARHHLFLAGGIGITPIMAMIRQLQRAGAKFTLHYCTRGVAQTAFHDELIKLKGNGRVILHHDGGIPAQGLDISNLLRIQPRGTHLYICGPGGFMRVAQSAAAHWSAGTVHFEHFAAEAKAKARQGSEIHDSEDFRIRVSSSGAEYSVPSNKSIVEVLRENGYQVDSSCEEGLCGACKTRYLSGEPVHSDYVLTDAEKEEWVMICCARCRSRTLELDI